MKQNTIENEIGFLYQQRKEIVKEKEYYLKELERINEKIKEKISQEDQNGI